MENKNFLILCIGILIFMGIYFFPRIYKKIKSRQPKKKRNPAKTNKTSCTTNTPKKSIVSRIINWIVAIIVVAIAIIVLSFAVNIVIDIVKKISYSKKQYRIVLVKVDSTDIYFGGDLSIAKEVRIDPIPYDGFEFSGATQPFCVYNAEGDRFCGEKGENPNMGNSTANRVLRFVSQNGEKGKITLIYLRKQKVRVK